DIASLPKIPSNPGAYLGQLALLTKWDPVQLAYLLDIGEPNPPNTTLNPLNLPDSGMPPVGCIPALADISLLQRISDCFTIAGQLKVVPSRCVGWVTDPITDKIATDIKQALKSMYPDETSWLAAVQPLMNTLRQERRDALVEYLGSNTVTNPFGQFDIFPDEFSIYGNFLIDVEMNACQPTTRTIQAYCSIQLFVQRCFLNLEYPNVQVDSTADPDWLQWTWMGTFESWYEARYIFLYPENFIIPQTLPGQSPFFVDMQNDLTQGAVTEEIVETAFGNYLESLDEVARLEVKGMWYDDPGSTLYVFARTYGGDPSVYYFRTLNAIGIWSAWEQVTADISGDEIIPVMQNGRLFLYWPVFTQTSDASNTSQKQTATDGNSTMASSPPDKYWKIQLAFSEYLNGKWTGKKVSKDYASSKTINFSDDGASWAPDSSDFVFIPLDIPPSVPGSASAAQKFGSVIQTLTMNNTIVIGMFVNNTQYSSDGNPEIDQPGEELTLLSTPNGMNAFVLDPLRGYPGITALSDWLDIDSMFAFLFIDDSNRFKNTWYSNMLVEGKLPLTPRQNGSDLATLLSNSSTPSCNTLLSLQMNLWAKWFFVNNGYIKPQHLGIMMPFFFQDASRTFFVKQLALTLPDANPALFPPYYYYADAKAAFAATLGNASQLTNLWNQTNNWSTDSGPLYEFDNFYHPYAHQFIRLYAQQGIGSILTRPIQLTGDYFYGSTTEVLNNPIINIADNPGYKPFSFTDTYSPNTGLIINASITEVGYPLDQVDFGLSSSYGRYNWELFFHNVLMSAMLLSQNQQFAEADAWFKCIFNPTDTSSDPAPQKFWVTKPFFENSSANVSIDKLILFYEEDPASEPDFWESVVLWRNDPYDPHMLAQLRITPYQYTTFMKYLDNLIAWANFYYAQYTMESVNQAIQLFMLALECLGPKPEAIPPVVETPVCSYYQLELNLEVLAAIDGKDGYLSDPIVQFENLLPPISSPYKYPTPGQKKIQMLPGLYFCIPPNPVLMAYWDIIETQLTKIRNCMNIKGQFQPLSPFPNVPGMGNNEGGGAGDWGGILPNYRFLVMIQKAIELCNLAIPLGAGLLSALEKQDAEALAMMHATQEVAVQQAIDKVKQLEITDANFSLTSLQDYATLLTDKAAYYNGLIQGGLISLEQQALAMSQSALTKEEPIATGTQLSGVLKQLPNFTMGINGAFGSPAATLTFGGISLGMAADSAVGALSFQAHFEDRSASIANTNATYARRLAEWNFQLQQANDELAQNSTQLKAAQNKIDIATQDEENQQLLIQNAEDIASFLQNKYTNQQLYTWMISQISNVFFQCYQLAYTIAKQAEICFRYELGIPGTSYINYGYWDSLHKGLLSGENLMSSIRQMEMDYYNLNVREYELTRQISLAQLDPVALLQLKAAGTCYLDIPEELFDLDYPGQYFRRIRSVSITLPGVVGPYTPVCLKMTLMANSVRISSTAGTAANYPRNTNSKGIPTNDSRFLDNVAMTQCIATSTAVNDNGLFEMNLKDERYLPFEGAGAISSWQLQLTSVYPQFDASSVTDLIIHFKYTSREGGPALQSVAAESLQKRLASTVTANGMALSRAFSARRDFPTQWYKFLNPVSPTDQQELDMDITNRFPFFTQGLNIKINSLIVLADMAGGAPSPSGLYISGVRLGATLMNLGTNAGFAPLLYYSTPCRDTPGVWKITNGNGQGTPPPPVTSAVINDLVVIFNYSLT
ncbi:MAG TPA: neuraminidase-like domain-containing protein, partial [Puia sp.]|nr:neuraminidase-like domain-containing protein [Puia sp.]